MVVDPKDVSLASLPSDAEESKSLNIGIVGFGMFGQFLAKRMSQKHRVTCIDKVDKVSTRKNVLSSQH
jgi:prephenate dehydrogenase